MTEKAELDRVRAIHRELEKASRLVHPDSTDYRGSWWRVIDVLGAQHDYTADEVRAWPETKAKLRQALIGSSPHQCHTLAVWRPGWSGCFGADTHVSNGWEDNPPIRANGSRGLCLYREMLDDAKPDPLPTGHPAPGSTGLRLNEEQIAALGFSKVTDRCDDGDHDWDRGKGWCRQCGLSERQVAYESSEHTGHYGGDDLGHEAVVAALTVALPANVEARKRNVDRLRREMDEGESRRAALVGLVHPVTNRALGRMR